MSPPLSACYGSARSTPHCPARDIENVSDCGGDVIDSGGIALRPPRNPAYQKYAHDAGGGSASRPAERRPRYPFLLGSFDLRLFPEPIFNIASGRIAALEKSVQQGSPASALNR